MKEIFGRRWCIREDDSLAFALRAVADATLSSLVPAVNTAISSIPSLLKVTENMVHPGGFEPPTARFVAEYSIQLSYGCIGKIYFTADIDIATKAISSKRWCIREDDSLAFALRAVAKATLSSLVPAVNSATSSIPSLLKISENMVHPGGFEPPTARFVAEYSIQLSYGCIGKIYFTADIDTATKAISSKRWCIREDSNLRPLGS